MTSCSAVASTAACRDEASDIVSPLLDKVLITVPCEEVPKLTSKPPGRFVSASKKAVLLLLGLAFPTTPPVSPSDARGEARSILALALPMILTGLLLYLRSMISMLFLGHLGGLALAGGSLAIGFANITGYSVLSGLAMGMEPICGQAFGAGHYNLIGITMQRTVLLLLAAAVPIGGLWMHMRPLLLLCGQEASIAAAAETYILASLPDLALQAFIHPVRIYLRTQSINLPLTVCAALAIAIHLPINYVLVTVLGLGIKGVAFASVLANLNLLLFLLAYILFRGVPKDAASINLRSFYIVGTPVALVLAFWLHYDFKGLWFGLLAAQATCMVRMLLVIGQTDWASEAKRSRQLTGAPVWDESDDDKSRCSLLDADIEQANDRSDRC
ncbi:unnamed protein product [Urochloa decumbens]|uniref:Multidrug and toxic compound extrusion protein n=1 Tax=Urochloa decumbens TaxID=240449 RepID=A0ABC9C6X5_9POAL